MDICIEATLNREALKGEWIWVLICTWPYILCLIWWVSIPLWRGDFNDNLNWAGRKLLWWGVVVLGWVNLLLLAARWIAWTT